METMQETTTKRSVKVKVAVAPREGFKGIFAGGEFWPAGFSEREIVDDQNAPPRDGIGPNGQRTGFELTKDASTGKVTRAISDKGTWYDFEPDTMVIKHLYQGRSIEQKLAELTHLKGGQPVVDREVAPGQQMYAPPLLDFQIVEDNRAPKQVAPAAKK